MSPGFKLEKIHEIIASDECNNLRLNIMGELTKTTRANKLYYEAAKEGIVALCGSELAMQENFTFRTNAIMKVMYYQCTLIPGMACHRTIKCMDTFGELQKEHVSIYTRKGQIRKRKRKQKTITYLY